ncbi:MAG: HNH endonuclease [Clostridium lundense]|nr:HNH endonuclease [Clostridium lundense]
MRNDRIVTVYSKSGKLLDPCTEKVAWVLIRRRRAVKLEENVIQILIDKRDLKELKKKVIKRDNRTCFYCGKVISESEVATVDHLNPKHITGTGDLGYDTEENLVCSCIQCNNHKADMPFEDYVIYRYALMLSFLYFKLGINFDLILDR